MLWYYLFRIFVYNKEEGGEAYSIIFIIGYGVKEMKHYLKDTGNLKNSMCELGMEGATWDINVLDKNANAFKSCYIEGGLSEEGCVMRQIPISPTTIQDIGKFDYM